MTNETKLNQALARIQVYTEWIQTLSVKRAADAQLISDLERAIERVDPKEGG